MLLTSSPPLIQSWENHQSPQYFKEDANFNLSSFTCPYDGCNYTTTNEDHLEKHVRQHDLQVLELDRAKESEARTEADQHLHDMKIEDIIKGWKSKLSKEKNLFRVNLPLGNAFNDPTYLDIETKTRVSTEIRQHIQMFTKARQDDGEYYLYTLHDPSGEDEVGFQDICSRVDRHTRFKIFLSSLFYIGHGKEERDSQLLRAKNQSVRNPRKQDSIQEIQDKGLKVYVHRFAKGMNKDQARYMRALALRATRLGGNVTNLKEEKLQMPLGSRKTTVIDEQLAGTLVLWEASGSLGDNLDAFKYKKARNSEKRGKKKNKYTREDDVNIVNYISSTQSYRAVGGVKFWISMETEGIVPGMSWQSMKERFRKRILPRINRIGLSKDEVRRFSVCHPGPSRRPGRRPKNEDYLI